MSDERSVDHALQPHCPPEPLTGPTRLSLDIVKVSDGYEFIERDPVTGERVAVEYLVTFEGRRMAQRADAAE